MNHDSLCHGFLKMLNQNSHNMGIYINMIWEVPLHGKCSNFKKNTKKRVGVGKIRRSENRWLRGFGDFRKFGRFRESASDRGSHSHPPFGIIVIASLIFEFFLCFKKFVHSSSNLVFRRFGRLKLANCISQFSNTFPKSNIARNS